MRRATAARIGLVTFVLAGCFASLAGPAVADAPSTFRCGAHVLTLGSEVLFDGKSIARTADAPTFVGRAEWRSDCAGVAWIQRSRGVSSLVVLTTSHGDVDARSWSLPRVAAGDRVFWAAANTVTVGEHLLKPRVIARWA